MGEEPQLVGLSKRGRVWNGGYELKAELLPEHPNLLGYVGDCSSLTTACCHGMTW